MSATLTLCAVLAVALVTPLTRASEARARMLIEGADAVEVGVPFSLTYELEHEAGATVEGLDADALVLDDSWIVFGSRREPARAVEASPGRERTRRTWELASLDPGERVLPALGVTVDGRPVPPPEEPARVTVRGVLGEGEDAPRPLRSFPDPFGTGLPQAASGFVWPLAAGALVLVALAYATWRARPKRAAVPPPPTTQERFARAKAVRHEDADALLVAVFELSDIVRSAFDEALEGGYERRALTDGEWLDAAQLPAETGTRMAAFLERCGRVKYAGETPTSWAFDELVNEAGALLETAKASSGVTAATPLEPVEEGAR